MARADEVLEPGLEVAGARDAGAARIKAAVALAKDPARKWDALAEFRAVQIQWPSALHDCYRALAELRVGHVSEARLVWDISAERNADRPKWCTGDLAKQLADAMIDYVPIELAVTPADAVIVVGELRVRNVKKLWWLCSECKRGSTKPVGVQVSAPGFATFTTTLKLEMNGAVLRTALAQPQPPRVEVDAGVPITPITPTAPPDAGVAVAAPPDAAPERTEEPLVSIGGKPVKHTVIAGTALGVSAVVVAGGIWFQRRFRNQGNALYPSDPAFEEASENFDVARGVTIGFGCVAGLSAAYLAWALISGDKPIPKIQINPNAGGFMFSVGGER